MSLMVNENLKIVGIEVKNLFNSKNYVINFNQDPNVTIIYGVNGTGKTTILRMIHQILSSNFIDLEKNNFESFIFKLKNNIYIEYIKNESIEKSEIIKTDKNKNFRKVWKPYSLKAMERLSMISRKKQIDYLSFYNYFVNNNLSKKIIQIFNKKNDDNVMDLLFELDETDNNFSLLTKDLSPHFVFELVGLFFKEKYTPIPDWFNEFIHSNPLLYIKTERLVQYKKLREEDIHRYKKELIEEKIIRVISLYSKELENLKRKYIEDFNEISQTLNRTFPKRVVNALKTPTEELENIPELEDQIKNIRIKEDELISFGLLTKKEQEIAEIEVESLKVPEIAKSISLWIKDTNNKHSKFDTLLEKLKLFKSVINNHLIDKEVKFDVEEGYYFLTNSGERLSGDKLSSGEQHIVVLSYQLIFLAKEESLILIDEPEISLHTIWQNNFVDDIIKMGKNKSLSFILATHSSEIINGQFSLIKKLEKS